MNVSHDHFGNLRRTSRMTTEKYGKINTKRKSNRKSTAFVNFLAVSRYRQLNLLDIFSNYGAPPGVLGIWGEGLFIFRELGSTANYFRGAGEQAHTFGDLGSTAKK